MSKRTSTPGSARPLATPCRQQDKERRDSDANGALVPSPMFTTPTAHGLEGKMYLVRSAIMPMLTTPNDDKPIIFQAFKMRGATLCGLQGRTLGTRKRYAAGDVAPIKRFTEEPTGNAIVDSVPETAAQRMVLWTPPEDDPEGRLEVVVDSMLSKVLREHQRVGLQFLYDCLMGLRDYGGCGCILADDMGLGKTLQSVAVIWTLLTQGGPRGKPACRKAVIVCPASLVKNWAGEFDKWLHGRCKYVALAVSGTAAVRGTLMTFKGSYEHKILIASYETFRGYAHEVTGCGIDLVICDEAHKLKNDESAVTKCIANLEAKRRLLISGTPIQNNLDEFFTLVSVANPGVFGDMSAFKKNYANPILRGREPTATAEERTKGQEKLEYISAVTGQFILRRTNRLNARFLPPKQIYNVFVEPTDFQRKLYKAFLQSSVAQKLLADQNVRMTRTVLATIKKLQSLVNHPFLVRSATQRLEGGFDDDETRALFEAIDNQERGLRSNQRPVHQELSGKLALLHAILTSIKASGNGDRIVIISNWTQTLDLIEKMCDQSKWPVHRLDGTMVINKRMKLVQDFNRLDNPNAFAFLLSSKAGGCGLNLIGANRLVMFDPDWNPANDRQAMGRVWRDGQKKECFIYRFFTTGTIDEKVYQRQICKDGLSTMMVTETGEDDTEMKESLSADLVKDLFTFDEETSCATHDMLECERCTSRQRHVPQLDAVLEDELKTWAHHKQTEAITDGILMEAGSSLTTCKVSFCMGCHIEYTAEQIAKIEEEERAEQQRREEAAAKLAAGETVATPKAATPKAATPAAATAPSPAAAPPAAAAATKAATKGGTTTTATATATSTSKPSLASPTPAAVAGKATSSSSPAPAAATKPKAATAATATTTTTTTTATTATSTAAAAATTTAKIAPTSKAAKGESAGPEQSARDATRQTPSMVSNPTVGGAPTAKQPPPIPGTAAGGAATAAQQTTPKVQTSSLTAAAEAAAAAAAALVRSTSTSRAPPAPKAVPAPKAPSQVITVPTAPAPSSAAAGSKPNLAAAPAASATPRQPQGRPSSSTVVDLSAPSSIPQQSSSASSHRMAQKTTPAPSHTSGNSTTPTHQRVVNIDMTPGPGRAPPSLGPSSSSNNNNNNSSNNIVSGGTVNPYTARLAPQASGVDPRARRSMQTPPSAMGQETAPSSAPKGIETRAAKRRRLGGDPGTSGSAAAASSTTARPINVD